MTDPYILLCENEVIWHGNNPEYGKERAVTEAKTRYKDVALYEVAFVAVTNLSVTLNKIEKK